MLMQDKHIQSIIVDREVIQSSQNVIAVTDL